MKRKRMIVLEDIPSNKSMKEKIKTIVAEILLLLGIALFTYGLFGFQSDYYCGQGEQKSCPPLTMGKCYKRTDPVVYYYYNNEDRTLLTTGVVLIIIGLFGMKKRNTREYNV